jgi:hypothetical protein
MELELVNFEHPTEVRNVREGEVRALQDRSNHARAGYLRTRLAVV